MTQASIRATFSSSRLIRALSELAVANTEVAEQQFAAKLGLLFDFSDALNLSAALKPQPFTGTESASAALNKAAEEYARVKNALSQSIRSSFTDSASARFKLPVMESLDFSNLSNSFEPYLRFYAAHQRDMDLTTRHLRATLRDRFAETSAAMKQLTTLDAALDDILAEKARKLFAGVPKLLEKRFIQLFQSEKNSASSNGSDSETNQPVQWLSRFHQDMQMVLLAELDVRLEPALGLLEAVNKEVAGN
ncbi:MAG TPA: DUF3348 family protein [Pseudomonadales bacterium]|nr:DUF3348 family protein [Pseudomonadales bacterium]